MNEKRWRTLPVEILIKASESEYEEDEIKVVDARVDVNAIIEYHSYEDVVILNMLDGSYTCVHISMDDACKVIEQK